LAILSGIEFRRQLDSARLPKHRYLIRASVGLLAALTFVYGVIAVLWEPFAPAYFSKLPPRYLAVAQHIRETTKPSDRVFVWGAYTPIYVMSNRLPATRFVAFKRGCGRGVQVPFEECWDSGPEIWPLLKQDLTASAPELIIDTAPANMGDFAAYPITQFPYLRELLATQYTKDQTINDVVVYRRVRN